MYIVRIINENDDNFVAIKAIWRARHYPAWVDYTLNHKLKKDAITEERWQFINELMDKKLIQLIDLDTLEVVDARF